MTILVRSPEEEAGEAGEGAGGAEGAGSGGAAPGAPSRAAAVAWVWPALTALLLSFAGIDGTLLGTDELVTWEVSRRSPQEIWALLHHVDAVHGSYYFLMHGWTAVFGDSHLSLRMPTVLAVTATAALVTLTGRRLFGQRAGLCAGTLFAVLPAASRFAQEARSYALVMLFASLATFLLLRALDGSRRPWGRAARWAAYGLCLAVLGLLHLIALTIVLCHAPAAVLRARRTGRGLWSFLLAGSAAAVCVLPVFLLGRSQASRQLFWLPRPDAWGLAEIWPQLFASALCAGAVIALAALAWREDRENVLLCSAVAVLPPFVLWAASHGEVSYFRYQYALFTVPAWALLAGAGLAGATRSRRAAAAVLAVVALLALPDQRRVRSPFEHDVPHAADYAGAARTIEKYYRPGDAVVYVRGAPWMLDQGLRYYLKPGVDPREVFLARSAADNEELFPVYCRVPVRCLAGESRIWVVVPGSDADVLQAVPKEQAAALRSRYTLFGTESLSGLTVGLLESKPAGAPGTPGAS
ncbi:glycosyltransferase family 39 protein [Streptomyces sp. NPDC096033]|uniref:glycosyltransferase family 39 protein n=1 Tax=Streptomyces sp. NPDC096033 TaxID=3366071 RepID=UPI00382E8CB4